MDINYKKGILECIIITDIKERKSMCLSFYKHHARKKMKIGLITFHRTTNFGSSLQTFGLYKKINNMGYDCELVDYRCPAIEKREGIDEKLILNQSLKNIVKSILFQPKKKKKYKALQDFSNNNMRLTKPYTPNTIIEIDEKYEKIFIGSDIVWGRDITNYDYTYFLNFVSNREKKYAFASSVGDYDDKGDNSTVSKLLSDFNRIAVRETEAVNWVKKLTGKDIDLVCDPTMLLTESEWTQIIPSNRKYSNYVLIYFRNKKNMSDAMEYAKMHHKKVVVINYELPILNVINEKPILLNDFLGLIRFADCVFTASYHGMLFSLYYNKLFYFYTRAHKSRVLSLAERVGVLDRCGDDIDVCKDSSSIDYKVVNMRMEKFRNESIQILSEMLR